MCWHICARRSSTRTLGSVVTLLAAKVCLSFQRGERQLTNTPGRKSFVNFTLTMRLILCLRNTTDMVVAFETAQSQWRIHLGQ